MRRIELALGLIAVLAIILKLKLLVLINADSAPAFYALTTLSIFYFFFSFALFNGVRLRDIFKRGSYKDTSGKKILGAIALGITISIITIGVLLKLLLLAGATEVTLSGLMALIIILILAIIFYFRSRASYYIGIFKRIAIYGALGFIFLLTPASTLIGIYYSDYPEYVELYKKVEANPENVGLRHQLEQMEERLFYSQDFH